MKLNYAVQPPRSSYNPGYNGPHVGFRVVKR